MWCISCSPPRCFLSPPVYTARAQTLGHRMKWIQLSLPPSHTSRQHIHIGSTPSPGHTRSTPAPASHHCHHWQQSMAPKVIRVRCCTHAFEQCKSPHRIALHPPARPQLSTPKADAGPRSREHAPVVFAGTAGDDVVPTKTLVKTFDISSKWDGMS